jgi:hypothetical protein
VQRLTLVKTVKAYRLQPATNILARPQDGESASRPAPKSAWGQRREGRQLHPRLKLMKRTFAHGIASSERQTCVECEIYGENVDSVLSEKAKGRRLDVPLNERTHG